MNYELKIIPILLLSILYSCGSSGKNEELTPEDQLVLARMDWVMDHKMKTATKYWPEFANTTFEGTLVYKEDSSSYIFEPNEKAERITHSKIHYGRAKVIRTDSLIGGDGYIMSLVVSEGGIYKDNIDHLYPVEYCSSVEITYENLPFVENTEIWSTMIIHEMFHHFQRNQGYEGIRNRNDLLQYRKEHPELKERIVTENDLLLQLIAEDTVDTSKIERFLELRKSRWAAMPQEIVKAETIMENVEGGGRFLEYLAMTTVEEIPINERLVALDTMYGSGVYFKDFDIENEPYLYNAGGERSYFYATGFNLFRLFEKLGIDYQETVFDNFERPLHWYLEDYLDN